MEIEPELNMKDEYHSRELTIKFSLPLYLNIDMGILGILFYHLNLLFKLIILI